MNPTIAKFIHTNARNWAFVAPRIALGVIMAAHGAQKLFGWFGGYGLQGTAGYFAQQLGITPGVFWAALTGVVTFGSLAGSMLPFILRRLGFDPASASAPFVATLVDVTGLVIYFVIASLILRGTLL